MNRHEACEFVVAREAGKCKRCKGPYPEIVHHVVGRGLHPVDLWEPQNMVHVCRSCDTVVHTKIERARLLEIMAEEDGYGKWYAERQDYRGRMKDALGIVRFPPI